MTSLCHIPSPLGMLTLSAEGEAITGLWLEHQKYFGSTLPLQTRAEETPVLLQASLWLERYFSGKDPGPVPPLAPQGSAFRQAVWALLQEIPYGQITTYGALTKQLQSRGIAASPQAVGGAVGHNPISILIPCHRVVGSGGSLTGYAGGIEKKRFLLELEGVDLTGLYTPTRGTAL